MWQEPTPPIGTRMTDESLAPDPRPLAGAALIAFDDAVTRETVHRWWQASRGVSRKLAASGPPSPGQQQGQVCLTAFLGDLHRLLEASDAERLTAINGAASQSELLVYLASKQDILQATMPNYLPVLQGLLQD